MKRTQTFPPRVLETIHAARILGVRAGMLPHRFTGVWVVVVDGRVFVRSYTLKSRSWYRTFLEDPRGAMQIAGGREVAVRARRTRSERVKAAVDRAYAEKYDTRASLKFVRGFRLPRRRDTTTELLPAGVGRTRIARPATTRRRGR